MTSYALVSGSTQNPADPFPRAGSSFGSETTIGCRVGDTRYFRNSVGVEPQMFSSEFLRAAGVRVANRLSKKVNEWSRIWGCPNLPNEIEISPNHRLTRTLARYRRDTGTIEVGERFLELRAKQAEILAHEMAHAAVDVLHGQRVATHGPEWKALIRAAGFTPAVFLSANRANTKVTRNTASNRYTHRCPVCHSARESSRPVRAWRCRSCVEAGLDGTLKITKRAIPK